LTNFSSWSSIEKRRLPDTTQQNLAIQFWIGSRERDHVEFFTASINNPNTRRAY
jgi:hypothetical protein